MPENCRHTWVAGMFYVTEDDLLTVASAGRRIECESCETVFDADNADHLPEWMRS